MFLSSILNYHFQHTKISIMELGGWLGAGGGGIGGYLRSHETIPFIFYSVIGDPFIY